MPRATGTTASRPKADRASRWFVYLIECVDRSVYTGIAVDVARRYAEHQAGTGARYTRSRPPVRLLGVRDYPDRSSASRAEAAIKRLSPSAKRALAADPTIPVVFIEPKRARRKPRPGSRSSPPASPPATARARRDTVVPPETPPAPTARVRPRQGNAGKVAPPRAPVLE